MPLHEKVLRQMTWQERILSKEGIGAFVAIILVGLVGWVVKFAFTDMKDARVADREDRQELTKALGKNTTAITAIATQQVVTNEKLERIGDALENHLRVEHRRAPAAARASPPTAAVTPAASPPSD